MYNLTSTLGYPAYNNSVSTASGTTPSPTVNPYATQGYGLSTTSAYTPGYSSQLGLDLTPSAGTGSYVDPQVSQMSQMSQMMNMMMSMMQMMFGVLQQCMTGGSPIGTGGSNTIDDGSTTGDPSELGDDSIDDSGSTGDSASTGAASSNGHCHSSGKSHSSGDSGSSGDTGSSGSTGDTSSSGSSSSTGDTGSTGSSGSSGSSSSSSSSTSSSSPISTIDGNYTKEGMSHWDSVRKTFILSSHASRVEMMQDPDLAKVKSDNGWLNKAGFDALLDPDNLSLISNAGQITPDSIFDALQGGKLTTEGKAAAIVLLNNPGQLTAIDGADHNGVMVKGDLVREAGLVGKYDESNPINSFSTDDGKTTYGRVNTTRVPAGGDKYVESKQHDQAFSDATTAGVRNADGQITQKGLNALVAMWPSLDIYNQGYINSEDLFTAVTDGALDGNPDAKSAAILTMSDEKTMTALDPDHKQFFSLDDLKRVANAAPAA